MTSTKTYTPGIVLTDDNSRSLGIGEPIREGVYWRAELSTDPDCWLPVTLTDEWYGKEVSDDMGAFFRAPFAIPTEDVAARYGITTEMGKRALELAIRNIQVLDAKQKDYGSQNIAAFGEFGVLVRCWDKVSRLRNLLGNVKNPKNESIEDSWLDLSNYAIIAALCRRGEWK